MRRTLSGVFIMYIGTPRIFIYRRRGHSVVRGPPVPGPRNKPKTIK